MNTVDGFSSFCEVLEFGRYLRIFVAKETASFSSIFRPDSSDFIAIKYFLRKKIHLLNTMQLTFLLGQKYWENLFGETRMSITEIDRY